MTNIGPFPTAAAIAAAIRKIDISVKSPIVADGELVLVQGDDYKIADGRALVFEFADAPSLEGATVKLTAVALVNGVTAFTATGTISGITVTFELTSNQTSQLFVGDAAYEYMIIGKLANGDEVTLGTGKIGVTE